MSTDSNEGSSSDDATKTQIPDGARQRRDAARDDVPDRAQAAPDTELPAATKVVALANVSDSFYDRGREVARGGIGRITEARDKRLGRVVALKELALDHPLARSRFVREVLVTARLQHPNIVPLHEAGLWPDGKPFYSMKLVDGVSLATAINDADSAAARLTLLPHITDAAEAIAYAHSERIIHRDLKPANILVGPFGETVVIDWGLAKDLDAPDEDACAAPDEKPIDTRITGGFDTADGAVLGTPAYMPPEQATGQPVDERADVYALGAMLYQLLTAIRPYAHVPSRRVIAHVIKEAPRPILDLAPDAPRDLIAIAEKAMQRRPEDRYRTAGEMVEELRRFATGRLVGAHQYSTLELLSRFVRRTRAVLITIALALVALLLIAALGVRRISRERDLAAESAVAARASEHAEAIARAEAETRADALVLEQSRSLLDGDPTAAITSLRRLRTMRPGAASLAADAVERGIARHVLRGHDDKVWAAAFLGQNVVSAGTDGVRLWDLQHQTSTPIPGHTDRVQTLAVAPNGARFATGSYDKTVRTWSADGSQEKVLRGHDSAVKHVAFVGNNAVASIDASGHARLWQLQTGSSAEFTGSGLPDGPMATSKDGRFVAIAATSSALHLWEASSMTRRDLAGHASEITSVDFSSDGEFVVSGSSDGEVWLWKTANNQGRRLGAQQSAISAVACSSNCAFVVTAGRDGELRLWTVSEPGSRLIGRHEGKVTSVTFARSDELIVSSSWDRTTRIWRRASGDVRVLRGHDGVVSTAAINHDATLLASASWDRTLRIWPLTAPTQRTIGHHDGGVRSVAVSPDGTHVASAGRDHTVGLWSVNGGGKRLRGHGDVLYRVRYSPDGRFIASSSDDETVRLWRASDGQLVRAMRGHSGDVEELSFSPDGAVLASASKDDTARLWQISDGSSRVIAHHSGDVTAVAFSPDGSALASAGRDRLVMLSPISGSGEERQQEHDGEVWDVAFAADGSWLASVGTDHAVRIWQLRGGDDWRRLPGDFAGARLVRIAGERIAVAGRGPIIWLCELQTDACRELHGHEGAVEDISFTADGATLVSAGADATVRVWDLDTGEYVTFRGHAATVFDVELSVDGSEVFSASSDGDVVRWSLRRPVPAKHLRAWLDEHVASTPRTSKSVAP